MGTGTVDQIENEIRVWSFRKFGNGIAVGVICSFDFSYWKILYPKAHCLSSDITNM